MMGFKIVRLFTGPKVTIKKRKKGHNLSEGNSLIHGFDKFL